MASFQFLHSIPFRFLKKKNPDLRKLDLFGTDWPQLFLPVLLDRRSRSKRAQNIPWGHVQRGQRRMEPSRWGTFNNSLSLYDVGQGLICSIWGDSRRFCYSLAGVLSKQGSQGLQAAFVILAAGGMEIGGCWQPGINPVDVRGLPSPGGRSMQLPLPARFPASVERLSGLGAQAQPASIT